MIQHYNDIFDFIVSKEADYKQPVPINDIWSWSMPEHIKTTELYTNSQLLTGKDDFKPIKNITRPILNLQHRTEDIEVKDVQIYVNSPEKYHLSFLVKKYHDDVFVKENDLETFFDELNVSRIDYGAGLSKKRGDIREVVPLQSIAFCDQTDILSGPIGLRHYYSPDQLMEMGKVGWGKLENGATISLEDLIALSKEEKRVDKNNQVAKTPGRYVEIYEVHGNLPKSFADPNASMTEYETRMYICAFYTKKDSNGKQGVILYTAPEKKSPFKLIKRDPVHGRALGFGGAEELFEAQVWTNYSMKRIIDMLDAASKTILKTTDPSFTNRNKVRDMDNLEVTVLEPGSDLTQVDTFPRNVKLFENLIVQLETHAKDMGASQDPIMGKESVSGTPFASLNAQIQQGLGLHDYRKGQYAKHLEEIYNDDFIPAIAKNITKGAKFLSELSLEELQYVTDAIVTNEANKRVKDMVLAGEVPTKEEIDTFKEVLREEFKKKGNKHFIEILKGDFNDAPLAVTVSISSKSKNLAQLTDKAVSIFKFAFANPQGFAMTMQIPGMAKSFNQILEFSGMSPVDFSGIDKMQISQPQPTPAQPEEAVA